MNNLFNCLILLVFSLSGVSGYAEGKSKQYEQAVFASGCFWCTEKDFESVAGVISAESGYIGGHQDNPSYQDVSKGVTGHTEAVLVKYDPKTVTYKELLTVYWYSVDPFVENRQFCDTGSQYRSAIFYENDQQKEAAVESLQALKNKHQLTKDIYTQILPNTTFWAAESYHQDYYKNNPIRYNFYRFNCGRDQRLKALWGDLAGWKPLTKTGEE